MKFPLNFLCLHMVLAMSTREGEEGIRTASWGVIHMQLIELPFEDLSLNALEWFYIEVLPTIPFFSKPAKKPWIRGHLRHYLSMWINPIYIYIYHKCPWWWVMMSRPEEDEKKKRKKRMMVRLWKVLIPWFVSDITEKKKIDLIWACLTKKKRSKVFICLNE